MYNNIKTYKNIFDLIHYLLLGAYSGCITKLLAIFRNGFVIFKDNYWNNKLTIVLPHPSPLNKKWIKDHPDFINKRIIEVRKIINNIITTRSIFTNIIKRSKSI